ncbi:MAG TPA: class I SAM-dependent rRNA methyltransferase [Thermoanaerobaculia bacterium]|nr:class I SAM-dependent rRNA methyltransferase [Thermoanaerobaculia bacterium]HUM30869.1 class I SAM-dependent rRNA methyltransferase [Thermoanaerobaculia bacterium]HXK69230.1 class I SAM-dependent rRNA methyltransferase [Thermoanaerobaculia bacterium]
MVTVEIKKTRERAIQNRHPWIFSGAVHRADGNGSFAQVVQADKQNVAWGLYNPKSQIRVRVIDFTPMPSNPERVIAERIRDAASMRREFLPAGTDAFRLINGEGDGLPGVIADIYGDVMVVSTTCEGWEREREKLLFPALKKAWGVRAVYLKDNVDIRSIEGLSSRDKWLSSFTVPMPIDIHESGLTYRVHLLEGQKTGFFLDQRVNRVTFAGMAHGLDILNAFCYTGAFSVAALKAGAQHVTNVDSSLPALDLAKDNHRINGIDETGYTLIRENAFEYLRYLYKNGKKFDAIILDPPGLCKSQSQVDKASRAYKDVNMQAMKLLRPGGLLMTFSCSGNISPTLFRQIIFGAAKDVGVQARILAQLGADWDHPISIYCPESEYLKGLLLRLS